VQGSSIVVLPTVDAYVADFPVTAALSHVI